MPVNKRGHDLSRDGWVRQMTFGCELIYSRGHQCLTGTWGRPNSRASTRLVAYVHTGQPSVFFGKPLFFQWEEPLLFRFHHCNVCCSSTDKGSSRSYNALLFPPRSILDCRDRTRLGPVTHLLDLIFKRTDQKHRIFATDQPHLSAERFKQLGLGLDVMDNH